MSKEVQYGSTELQYDSTELFKRKKQAFRLISNKWVFGALTFGPVLLMLGFLYAVPIAWTIAASVHQLSAYSPEWTYIGLENYYTVFDDAGFWASIRRAAVYAVGTTFTQLIAGTAIALAVNRSFRFSSVVRSVVLLPYVIPTVVVAFLALWMGNSQWGVINSVLLQTNLIQEPIAWFGATDLAMISAIAATDWRYMIFATIIVLARLQSIPDEYYEAAETFGASTVQMFRYITLPNLKGVLFIIVLLRGIWMFNQFDIIHVLTGGGPGDVTTTVPIYAYQTAFVNGKLGLAAAMSTLLFSLLAVVGVIYFWVFQPSSEVRVE